MSIRQVQDSAQGVEGFLAKIRKNLQLGWPEVYDADLQSYFDTIPHDKLMACVEMRMADRSVLGLIRMWLKAMVVEPGEGPKDPPKVGRSDKGTPQGGVISRLRDPEVFKRARVNTELGVVTWDDEVDIAPETAHSRATGSPMPEWMEANEQPDAHDK